MCVCMYVCIYVCIYILFHLVCCSVVTFISLYHNVCSPMPFLNKFLTFLIDLFLLFDLQ